jgi:hypothetical protein
VTFGRTSWKVDAELGFNVLYGFDAMFSGKSANWKVLLDKHSHEWGSINHGTI